MDRRQSGDLDARGLHLIMPVQLAHMGKATRGEVMTEPQWYEHLDPFPGGQSLDGRQIQMVVMVVRQQQDVDRRQPDGGETGRCEALGAERRQR